VCIKGFEKTVEKEALSEFVDSGDEKAVRKDLRVGKLDSALEQVSGSQIPAFTKLLTQARKKKAAQEAELKKKKQDAEVEEKAAAAFRAAQQAKLADPKVDGADSDKKEEDDSVAVMDMDLPDKDRHDKDQAEPFADAEQPPAADVNGEVADSKDSSSEKAL
jgi:hypothetical protein